MWRIGQIADRDGITSAAVSKMVKRLVREHGLEVEKSGDRVTAVNLAHYDDLRGKFNDPSKAQGAKTPPAPTGYEQALADKTTYDAERSRLRLMVEIGDLVEREKIENAMDDASLRIGRAIDQIAGNVDELAAAYDSAGIQGLRLKLKELVRATRDQVADILDAEAATAPETGTA